MKQQDLPFHAWIILDDFFLQTNYNSDSLIAAKQKLHSKFNTFQSSINVWCLSTSKKIDNTHTQTITYFFTKFRKLYFFSLKLTIIAYGFHKEIKFVVCYIG